jgi:hypothetical protein
MKVTLDMGQNSRHGCERQMQLTGTIYFDKRGAWSSWMARRVARPVWQTNRKIDHPGQQEELI